MPADSAGARLRVPEVLRDIVAARRPVPADLERCELCAAEIPGTHGHVVDVGARTLLCVCRACYLLFLSRGAAGGRFLSVPDRYAALPEGALDAAAWDALDIPVRIACLFRNSAQSRVVALYPSPAGATESLLPLEAWPAMVRACPMLESLADDVEALLVRRHDDRLESYIVPIDACYELVGRLRADWQGFHGGEHAWRSIEAFFGRVRERSGGGRPHGAEGG